MKLTLDKQAIDRLLETNQDFVLSLRTAVLDEVIKRQIIQTAEGSNCFKIKGTKWEEVIVSQAKPIIENIIEEMVKALVSNYVDDCLKDTTRINAIIRQIAEKKILSVVNEKMSRYIQQRVQEQFELLTVPNAKEG